MVSKPDYYMNEGCFQSASSCGKYPYIGDLYLPFFLYCFIFYEILRLSFWLKSSLVLQFLAFHWHSRFCVNEYIAKIYTEIICNIFFPIALMFIITSNTADFEISIFNLTHKVPSSTSFEIRKILKRMLSRAYIKWIKQNTAFHRCLHSDALFGHHYTYLHVQYLAC